MKRQNICEEIEIDLIRNNIDKAYNKVKRLKIPKTRSNVVKDKTGGILFEN